ncbi:MAG: PIG-L deacetylase family protein [Vulcanimicrobiota bacterium]
MPKTVLSFGAHPDDIEIGCGGTEALLLQKGFDIVHVYATSGECGSRKSTKEKLAAEREKEASEAAKILGVWDVEFLHYPDGLTAHTREMKMEIITLIRRVKPQIIFIHHREESFPDHRVISDLIMSSVTGAAGPWFQETEGEPWMPELILGYEVWAPLGEYQMAVDISDTIEQKMQALSCYRSQNEETAYQEAMRGLARYRGVMSFAGTYAEVFQVIKGSFSLIG